MPREPEPPVGEDIPRHGQHRHGDQRRKETGERRHTDAERGDPVDGTLDPIMEFIDLADVLRREAPDGGCRHQPTGRQGGVADPRRVQPDKDLFGLVDRPASRPVSRRHVGRHPVQQLPAQLRRHRRGQGVEDDPVCAQPTARGSDLHPGQPKSPVPDRRRDVDRADPIGRRRQQPPVDQPLAQLDLATPDPISGRDPAHDAQHHDDGEDPEVPPLAAIAGAPGQEDHQQGREEPHRLLHRVDKEHPRIEAAPLRVASKDRRYAVAHVASPRSAAAAAVNRSTRAAASS